MSTLFMKLVYLFKIKKQIFPDYRYITFTVSFLYALCPTPQVRILTKQQYFSSPLNTMVLIFFSSISVFLSLMPSSSALFIASLTSASSSSSVSSFFSRGVKFASASFLPLFFYVLLLPQGCMSPQKAPRRMPVLQWHNKRVHTSALK